MHSPSKRDRCLGLTFILLVSGIWVVASFAVQGIEERGVNPLVVTYIANSLFALYLPIHLLGQSLGAFYSSIQGTHQATKAHHLSATLRAAALVAPLWFLAQWTFNVSLRDTTVTSNTILSSLASVFTFMMSVFLLDEVFTGSKLTSILLCFVGTAVITCTDTQGATKHSTSVTGDALCLLSGLFYAAYTVSIKTLLSEDSGLSMALFFGLLGVCNAAFFAPLVLSMSSCGLSRELLYWILLKGVFDNMLSDYLWARAVLLLGPTVATVGLSIQIPLAVIMQLAFKQPDWFHNTLTEVLMFLGGLMVLLGFYFINVL